MTGFEPLTAAATAGLTSLVIDIIKGQGSNTIARSLNQGIGKAAQQAYFDASRQYIQTYAERHCSLKVLGMREPVSLESVYTAVQVLDGEDRGFASVEDLEQAFRETQSRRFRFTEDSKKDGLEIAIAKQYLMVLGAPGSGKSTFLRKMGLEALKGKQGGFRNHHCFPILLELKRFTEAKVDLKKLITTEFQICGFPNAEQLTQKALEHGKLLILLDGLDEVPSVNRDNVIETIQDFVDQYDKNRYIISCRIAVSRRSLPRFTDVTVSEFDNNQIQQFIRNWFKSEVDRESGTAERCWELLQQLENIPIKELASTPLFLTFLCLVYDRSQTFSNNRSTLYRKALRILLEEWAAEKRIMREEIYQGLNTELEEVLLSEIAYRSFDADRLFLPQAELVAQIKTFLASNLNVPKHLSGEKVLDAIAVQQGILVERAEDVYSFSHLILQEYLTAKYIVDHRRIELLVVQRLTDRRWNEIFLLVAGAMYGGVDELLLKIDQALQKYIETPKLNQLLTWAEQITSNSETDLKRIAKCATALLLALTFIPNTATAQANALQISRIQNLDDELYLALENSQSFINFIGYFVNTDLFATSSIYAKGEVFDLSTSHDIENKFNRLIEIIHHLSSTELRIFEGVDFTKLVEQLQVLQPLIPRLKNNQELSHYFSESIRQACFEGFSLNTFLLGFSQEEIRSIDDYLYATCCLLSSSKAASRVSLQVWEVVMSRVLLPDRDHSDRELLLVQRFLKQVGAVVHLINKRSLEVSKLPEVFRLTSPLPILIVVDKPSKQDIDELFQHSNRLFGEHKEDHAGILLYQESPDTLVREQIADLRLNHHFMTIPVSLAEVEKALPSTHECSGILKSYINRYMEQVNFFDDNNAISDKTTFFGRIRLLQQLEQGLLRNQGVGLFGLRKSGKTSILLQLELLLQDYPVVYIDLQRYGGSRYGAELFNEILQRLSLLLNEGCSPSTEALDLFEPGTPAKDLTNQFASQMGKLSLALQGVGYKKPILCFLDEVERILPGPREDQREMVEEFNACFGVLRALSQEQQGLTLLVADVHPDCNQINQWQQEGVPTNPVYSFFKEVLLKPFSEEDTKTMLTDIGGLMKLKFDEKTLEEIHRLSGGHPYVSRQLAGLLCKKIVTEEDGLIHWANAQRYLERPFAYARHIMNYIEGSIWKDLEKRGFKAAMVLLRVLSLDQNKECWMSEQTLLSILNAEFTESQCLDALLWLEDVGLITQEESAQGNVYRLHLVLLSNWLRMQVIEGENN